MTTLTAFREIASGTSRASTTSMQQTLRWWTAGLFLSAAFATVSGVAGIVIAILTFGGNLVSSTSLYTTGTVLIGASFILFGLAAHCLDKADAAKKAIRLEYCRQHGLNDDSGELEDRR